MNRQRVNEPTENWDDDFDFQLNNEHYTTTSGHERTSRATNDSSALPQRPTDDTLSNAHPTPLKNHILDASSSRNHTVHQQPESWDDDFEIEVDAATAGPSTPPHSTSLKVETGARTSWSSSDDGQKGLGFTDETNDDEDRTVTAKSRAVNNFRQQSPPPPVPPLPDFLTDHSLVPPRSPTLSGFSIPLSGRESTIHGSTAHLALRQSHSGGSGPITRYPNVPAPARPRRRLRKKSRPSHIDNDIIELEDVSSPASRPTTPESSNRPSTPPPGPPLPPTPVSPPSGSKGPLLSRIGTVKNWRKGRSSTGPSEFELGSTPDARNSRFFRGNEADSEASPPGLAVRHKDSRDLLRRGTSPETPTRSRKKPSLRLGITNRQLSSSSLSLNADQATRRTQRSASVSSYRGSVNREPTLRVASHGAAPKFQPSTIAFVSASVENLESTGIPPLRGPKDGHRGLIGNVRRIGLVGAKRHKRNKSGIAAQATAVASERASLSDQQAHSDLSHASSSRSQPLAQDPSTPQVVPRRLTADNLDVPSPFSTPHSAKTPRNAANTPQSASLGRATIGPSPVSAAAAGLAKVPRRNSLGDLKIPSRITQAQAGLRRDLGMVREFAGYVDRLKALQLTYTTLIRELRATILGDPSSSTAPLQPLQPRTRTRPRSDTNPPPPKAAQHKRVHSALQQIDRTYKIWWECAELLIELGSGQSPAASSPQSSTTTSTVENGRAPFVKTRGRASTLSGDDMKPVPDNILDTNTASPPSVWKASKGQQDLSVRQIYLLKEMMSTPDPNNFVSRIEIPEESSGVNGLTGMRPEGSQSLATLPASEDSSHPDASPSKKRRSSRLGMNGIRDILRSLKRNQSENIPPPSDSRDSSLDGYPSGLLPPSRIRRSLRRNGKTSNGPESVRLPVRDSYATTSAISIQHKSPRRPSLASIFRIGQKNSRSSSAATPSNSDNPVYPSGSESNSGADRRISTEDEDDSDWDQLMFSHESQLDSAASALGISNDGMATVKGRRINPANFLRHAAPQPRSQYAASQTSLGKGSPSKPHVMKLALPVQTPTARSSSDFKMSLTPENIKPLLEYARATNARLGDCIEEVRGLMGVSL